MLTRNTRARLCTGLLLATGACVQVAPQVRNATLRPPQECPPGAQQAMDLLGLHEPVVFDHDLPGHEYVEDKWSLVREGPASMWVVALGQSLPEGTEARGVLHHQGGRILGRFTELRTPDGRSFPVCLELYTGLSNQPGDEVDERRGDGYLIGSAAQLRRVTRFK